MFSSVSFWKGQIIFHKKCSSRFYSILTKKFNSDMSILTQLVWQRYEFFLEIDVRFINFSPIIDFSRWQNFTPSARGKRNFPITQEIVIDILQVSHCTLIYQSRKIGMPVVSDGEPKKLSLRVEMKTNLEIGIFWSSWVGFDIVANR